MSRFVRGSLTPLITRGLFWLLVSLAFYLASRIFERGAIHSGLTVLAYVGLSVW